MQIKCFERKCIAGQVICCEIRFYGGTQRSFVLLCKGAYTFAHIVEIPSSVTVLPANCASNMLFYNSSTLCGCCCRNNGCVVCAPPPHFCDVWGANDFEWFRIFGFVAWLAHKGSVCALCVYIRMATPHIYAHWATASQSGSPLTQCQSAHNPRDSPNPACSLNRLWMPRATPYRTTFLHMAASGRSTPCSELCLLVSIIKCISQTTTTTHKSDKTSRHLQLELL